MQYIQSPITINGKEIKNRVAVPPMADFGATGSDGLVNERHLAHYRAFADGGAGLIIIEACTVSQMREPRHTISLYDDICLPGLTKLAEAAKINGAVALVQLLNSGQSAMPELSIAEIPRERFIRYKEDFVTAAVRCCKAGFDGVELHAAHGFFLNQVVESSVRTDEYGGSFENRVRILCELIAEIKQACGAGFIVGVRFGSPNEQELLWIAAAIEEAGADILDVSYGCRRGIHPPKVFSFSETLYMASLVKKNARVPVIGVGGIAAGEAAEDILRRGFADIVAVGRGQLCDPAWASKVISGQEPNPCLHCRVCRWFADGTKCPARLALERGNERKLYSQNYGTAKLGPQ